VIDIIALREKLTKMVDALVQAEQGDAPEAMATMLIVAAELRELEMALWKEESQ
jgi:hypothetical protein